MKYNGELEATLDLANNMVDWPYTTWSIQGKIKSSESETGGMVSCILVKISGDNYRNITKTKRSVLAWLRSKYWGPTQCLV